MSVTSLTQIVRASLARARDVALRSETAAPAQASTDAPVGAAAPARAVIAEATTPRGEQLRAAVAQRGGVTATIVAALGGNRYVVDVDGEETPLVLEGASISDDRPLLPGAQVRLVARPDRAETPTPQNGTAPRTDPEEPRLSTMARLIASATRDDRNLAGGPARSALDPARLAAAAAPIAPEPIHTLHTAETLRQVVDRSGLFYESHLAEWVSGDRTLDSLRHEPQAKLASAAHDPSRPEGLRDALPILTREAASLVREQIQALQAQQVAWQGTVWGDQRGQIEIGRDPSHAGEAGTQTWRARLALDLPALGRVEVRLTLHGADLGIQIQSADTASHVRIDSAAPVLHARLEGQGLRPRVSATEQRSR